MQFFHDNDEILDFGWRPSLLLGDSIADSSIGTPLEDLIKWHREKGKKEVLPRNQTLGRVGNDTRAIFLLSEKRKRRVTESFYVT
jgi:hypothetical protein